MLAEFLFVYGTLKREALDNNSAFLEPYSEFFGYATAPGKLYLKEDDVFMYPGFVYDSEAENTVRGELYVITDKQALFEKLDEYEGCSTQDPEPHQYLRRQITVKSNVAFEYEAWTYIYNWPIEDLKEIASGSFI